MVTNQLSIFGMSDQPDYLLGIHEFIGRTEDELDIHKGDYVEVIEDDAEFGDSWYIGKNLSSGKTGLFPKVFTTSVATPPAAVFAAAATLPQQPAAGSGPSGAAPRFGDPAGAAQTPARGNPQTQAPGVPGSALAMPSAASTTSIGSAGSSPAPPQQYGRLGSSFDASGRAAGSHAADDGVQRAGSSAGVYQTAPLASTSSLNGRAGSNAGVKPTIGGSPSTLPGAMSTPVTPRAEAARDPRADAQPNLAVNTSVASGPSNGSVGNLTSPPSASITATMSDIDAALSEIAATGPSLDGIGFWTPQDVQQYFTGRGYDDATADAFLRHRITGLILLELDLAHLKEIDITSFGTRFEISKEIKYLNQLVEQTGQTLPAPNTPALDSTPRMSPNSPATPWGGRSPFPPSQLQQQQPLQQQPLQQQPGTPGYFQSQPQTPQAGFRGARQPSGLRTPADGYSPSPSQPQQAPQQAPQPPQHAQQQRTVREPLLPSVPTRHAPAQSQSDFDDLERCESPTASEHSRKMSQSSGMLLSDALNESGAGTSRRSDRERTPEPAETPVAGTPAYAGETPRARDAPTGLAGSTGAAGAAAGLAGAAAVGPAAGAGSTNSAASGNSATSAAAAAAAAAWSPSIPSSSTLSTPEPQPEVGSHMLRSASDAARSPPKQHHRRHSSVLSHLDTTPVVPPSRPEQPKRMGTFKGLRSASSQYLRPAMVKQKTSAFVEGIQSTTAQESEKTSQCSGWMYKRGGIGVGSWKSRFFTLHGTRLSYFLNFEDTKERGLIDIMGHRVVAAKDNEDKLITLYAAGVGAGRHCFKLVPPAPGYKKGVSFTAPKTHYFAVETRDEMQAWISALMKATIERDESVPVISSCTTPSVSLPRAQEIVAQRLAQEAEPTLPSDFGDLGGDIGDLGDLDEFSGNTTHNTTSPAL